MYMYTYGYITFLRIDEKYFDSFLCPIYRPDLESAIFETCMISTFILPSFQSKS